MSNQNTEKRIVLTFGTFDRLHPWHEYYLNEAKKYWNYLVTIVARDSTVLRVKGRNSVYDEQIRLSNLQSTWWSDEVVLGHESWFDRCLDYYKPDVICLGYDQGDITGKLWIMNDEWWIEIFRIPSYMPEKWKSSLLAS
jgi:FAD synthetase